VLAQCAVLPNARRGLLGLEEGKKDQSLILPFGSRKGVPLGGRRDDSAFIAIVQLKGEKGSEQIAQSGLEILCARFLVTSVFTRLHQNIER
jgi:hypothetical protein